MLIHILQGIEYHYKVSFEKFVEITELKKKCVCNDFNIYRIYINTIETINISSLPDSKNTLYYYILCVFKTNNK